MDAFTITPDTKYTSKSVSHMIFSLAMPVSLLKAVLVPGLSHTHAGVKEAVSRLLVCVLSRLSCHLKRAQELLSLSEADVHATSGLIQSQLSHILPPVALVWDAWQVAVSLQPETPDAEQTGAKKSAAIPTIEAPKVS